MFRNEALSNIVELEGNYYYIDSCYTFDHGYETMIFPCDSNGNVTDWGELYAEWYEDRAAMEARHKEIVADLKSTFENATEENKSFLSRLIDALEKGNE